MEIQKILWPREHSRGMGHHKVSALKEAGTKQGHLISFGMDLLPDLIKHTDWGGALFKLHDAV